jgi:hypothetical protein
MNPEKKECNKIINEYKYCLIHNLANKEKCLDFINNYNSCINYDYKKKQTEASLR